MKSRSNQRITEALLRQFERYRVVFWYDEQKQWRDFFETVDLPNVEKAEIANNEFALKYRVLRLQPEQKFLLYFEGPEPSTSENWLLDLQLAGSMYSTSLEALWISELGLGNHVRPLVQEHSEFFADERRRTSLHKRVGENTTARVMRQEMLAVCAGCKCDIEDICLVLLDRLAQEQTELMELISKCNLDKFLYSWIGETYDYASETVPNLNAFALFLFRECYRRTREGLEQQGNIGYILLDHWNDSQKYRRSFEIMSRKCAELLGVKEDLEKVDWELLKNADCFELFDQVILHELFEQVTNRAMQAGVVNDWLKARRSTYWYPMYIHMYLAVGYAAEFLESFRDFSSHVESVKDGIEQYTKSWYKIDQLYRKFIYEAGEAGPCAQLSKLTSLVDGWYVNKYLVRLGDSFQAAMESYSRAYNVFPSLAQQTFHSLCVMPAIRGSKGSKRVAVIISDALRYEIGVELSEHLSQEKGYNVKLESGFSMLPSYTELGMAALLPHDELRISDTGKILVDGASCDGLKNREAILHKASSFPAAAQQAEQIVNGDANAKEQRGQCTLLYVYHNSIDARGDHSLTENEVFRAAKEAIDELQAIVKQLSKEGYRRLLITADHGFIYQNAPVEDGNYTDEKVVGQEVVLTNRRFAYGHKLADNPSFQKYLAASLGLAGDMEIQIPKSISRLRLKGGGARYVHGGATLQEMVIPVIDIGINSRDVISQVDVTLADQGNIKTITSGHLTVTLKQDQPCSDKVKERVLKVGLYTKDGRLISDSQVLHFDSESGDFVKRTRVVTLYFSQRADQANGQDVTLKLEEVIPGKPGETKLQPYLTREYHIQRYFTQDF